MQDESGADRQGASQFDRNEPIPLPKAKETVSGSRYAVKVSPQCPGRGPAGADLSQASDKSTLGSGRGQAVSQIGSYLPLATLRLFSLTVQSLIHARVSHIDGTPSEAR